MSIGSARLFPLHTVNDASMQPQIVVLTTMPGSEPFLRVYCKTEDQMDAHFLSPATMLRDGQGDEFFRQQLGRMMQMVPASQCDSESTLTHKLRARAPSGSGATSLAAMDVDPL